MSVLNGNVEKAKLAAVMLLTSPGTPFIYYGEEIGMQGKKPNEDIRLPMQWSADANAGFTVGTPWRAPDANYAQVNVAAEEKDPNSLLNLYHALTKLRAEHPALRTGSLTLLDTGNPGVYAMLRRSDAENLLILINLKATTITDYALALNGKPLPDEIINLESLIYSTQAASKTIIGGIFKDYKPLAELPPYQAYIFQLK
jgi:glycosidase